MPFDDLRTFIARLEKEGDVNKIEQEADWNLQVGAITRKCNEGRLPAPFFLKIKGYPEGFRILGTPLGTFRRIAIAMDLAPDTPIKDIIQEYYKRQRNPIKPVLVKSGPCKENIQIGDEVDLMKLPVPMIHQGDGGRYIGTFHLTIARDPDSDWINWAMQRHMLQSKNSCGVLADPYTHLGMLLRQKYEPRNKPTEVAIAIGVDPISTMAAVHRVPYGVSEVDLAGAIRGKPVELVKCETIDLTVPATAEIVIEGEIKPHARLDEGPFGEYPGYMSGGRAPRPLITVKAVTHRNNPIFTMTCEGVPVTETHTISAITNAADMMEVLNKRGFPVTGIAWPPEAATALAVVAVKVPFANIASELAMAIWATRLGRMTPYIIIVEDDVDPHNLQQVFHALATKCHPYKGINKFENAVAGTLMPFLSEHERQYQIGGKAYFDCTWPRDWKPENVPKRMSFNEAYPADVQKKALALMKKFGYQP